MTRQLIAIFTGALVTLGAATSRAQVGPGIGTPLVPGATSTNSRVGTRGANFLEIGLGARAMGMAGAYSSLAEGLSAMYWNIAGTAEAQNVAGGIDYASLYGSNGLSFAWGGILLPAAGGVFGFQIGQMSSGDLLRTDYAYPDGGDPVVGNSFQYTGTMAEVSYARRLTDRLDFGLGGKYASEGMQTANATYYGVDVGIKFRTGLYGTTLGASLANVGSSGKFSGSLIESNQVNTFDPSVVRIAYSTQSMEMPTIFRFSVLSDLVGGPESLLSQTNHYGAFHAVLEFSNGIDTDLQSVLGGEYSWHDMLFLRAGHRWYNEGWDKTSGSALSRGDYWNRGTALGGGIRLPLGGRKMSFDYAWQGMGELPANNQFSFEFGF